MKKYISLLLLFFAVNSFAQHKGGLLPDNTEKVKKIHLIVSKEHSKKNAVNIVGATVLSATNLPIAYNLAIPPAENQGNEGACAGFSTTYARSIEQYYKTGAITYSFSQNIFSPEFIYDYAKFTDCNSGSSIGSALDVFKNKGVCLYSILPYSDTNGCDSAIAKPYDVQASQYKIASYSKLISTDRTGIKTMIANNHPVVIGIIADDSFINAGANFIWSSYSGSGALPHAITIVGYDDNFNSYKILNSWGAAWGDNGTSRIDYNFFETGGKVGYYVYTIDSLGSVVSPPPVDTTVIPPQPAESINISVVKVINHNKVSDKISWQIKLNNTPQSQALQYSATASTFATIFNIATSTGSYNYNSKAATRYYRIKVVKSDGTISYSSTQNIK